MTESSTAALAAISAALFALGAVPAVRAGASKAGVVCAPLSNLWDERPTPLLGGVAIVGAYLASLSWIGAPAWLVTSTLAMLLVGSLDDVVSLSPGAKFLLQLLAVAIAMSGCPQLELLRWRWLDSLATGFWLLSAVNAVNFIDGLDGQAAGVSALSALAIAVLAFLNHAPNVAIPALTLAGALAGFLFYNFSPASIFMGDAGALPLGLNLGMLAIYCSRLTGGGWLARAAMPPLLLLMPIMDAVIVVVTRIATGNAFSRRGFDHSHHRLVIWGLSVRQTVMVAYTLAVAGVASAIVVGILPAPYPIVFVPFAALFFALVALFLMDLSFETVSPAEVYRRVPRLARGILKFGYKLRIVEVGLDSLAIAAAYYGAFLLRSDFRMPAAEVWKATYSLPLVLIAGISSLMVCRVYRGIWRYHTFADATRFTTGSLLAGAVLFLAARLLPLGMPLGAAVIFVLLLLYLLVGARFSFRVLAGLMRRLARTRNRMVIVGAGTEGEAAARFLGEIKGGSLRGFVDDDEFKRRKLVRGYPVLGPIAELEKFFAVSRFNEILIAQKLDAIQLKALHKFAEAHQLRLRTFSIRIADAPPEKRDGAVRAPEIPEVPALVDMQVEPLSLAEGSK